MTEATSTDTRVVIDHQDPFAAVARDRVSSSVHDEKDRISQSSAADSDKGPKKTGSTGSPTTKINHFKRRIWVFQLFLVAFVLALCVSQLITANSFFQKSKKDAATLTSVILKETIDVEKSIVLTLSESRPIYAEFLQGLEHSRDEIESIFIQESTPFHVEINTLVNADKKIVASAFDTRIGTVFDPNGVVSRLFESYSNGVSSSSISQSFQIVEITKEDFQAANCPYVLSTEADGFGNRYTMRVQNKGLMLLAVGAILSEDGNTLLGAKVAGYLLTGKQKIVRDALASVGSDAFAGVLQKSGDEFDIAQFLLASGISESRIYTDYHDDQSQMLSVYNSEVQQYDVHQIDGIKYTVSLFPLPKGSIIRNSAEASEEEDSKSPGLLTIGKANTLVDGEMATNNVTISAFLCATVLVVLVNAGLADVFFIKPIHDLVVAVDKKDQAKMSNALDRMKMLKKAVGLVVAGVLIMTGLLGAMLLVNYSNVTNAFVKQSSAWSQHRMFEMFYMRRAFEHFVDARGMAVNPNFKWILGSNYTEDIWTEVITQLSEWTAEHEVEVAFVLNASMNVISTSTVVPDSNFRFDPNGIITEVLASRSSIRANIVVEKALYQSLNPASFGSSTLRAGVTNSEAAVQLTAVPIFESSWKEDAVGVLVIFATLNGEPKDVNTRAIQTFGESCSGIFYVKNGEAVLVSSALQAKNSEVQIDADIATEDVKQLVLAASKNGEFKRTPSLSILGTEFEVTAEQVFPGSQYDDDGHEHLSRAFDDGIYLVQCSSRSEWDHLVSTIKAISSVTFAFMFIASAVLTYVTFKPIFEFGQRYQRKWSAKSASGANKLSLGNVVKKMGRSQKSSRTSSMKGD